MRYRSITSAHRARDVSRGFTLVETLVAISVLMLAIVGPMTIASRSMQSAFLSRDQIIAFYLAQEAIEIVRFQRDSNAIANAAWMNGLHADCFTETGCRMRLDRVAGGSNIFDAACTGSNCLIRLNVSTDDRWMYSHLTSGAVATPFTRTIRIRNVGSRSANEVREVVATVTWPTVFMQRSVEVRTYLYNHYTAP